MTSSKPIKKEIKDLNLQQLKMKKKQIVNFLLTYPFDKRNARGWATLNTINDMILSKENNNQLQEEAIKALFFEN